MKLDPEVFALCGKPAPVKPKRGVRFRVIVSCVVLTLLLFAMHDYRMDLGDPYAAEMAFLWGFAGCCVAAAGAVFAFGGWLLTGRLW